MRQLTLTRRPAESPGWRDCFELNRALTRLDSADRIARFVAENVRSFNAVNVATACHLLAKMHSQARRLRNRMQSRGQSGGEGRDVGQAILALLARASVTVDSFKPQNVANLMWALATLGVEPGAELATAMSRRAVASAGEFKPQEVANLMWALATLGVDPGAELATAMSRRAVASAHQPSIYVVYPCIYMVYLLTYFKLHGIYVVYPCIFLAFFYQISRPVRDAGLIQCAHLCW